MAYGIVSVVTLRTVDWQKQLKLVYFTSQDSIVKQGLTTQQSEALLSTASDAANTVDFDIKLSQHFIEDSCQVTIHAGRI